LLKSFVHIPFQVLKQRLNQAMCACKLKKCICGNLIEKENECDKITCKKCSSVNHSSEEKIYLSRHNWNIKDYLNSLEVEVLS